MTSNALQSRSGMGMARSGARKGHAFAYQASLRAKSTTNAAPAIPALRCRVLKPATLLLRYLAVLAAAYPMVMSWFARRRCRADRPVRPAAIVRVRGAFPAMDWIFHVRWSSVARPCGGRVTGESIAAARLGDETSCAEPPNYIRFI